MTQNITVVIPTFNEAENLPRLVSALFALPLELRVLVVDDNSPDGTGQIADSLASQHPERFFVLHRPGRMGFGAAYLTGFQQAIAHGADLIVQMDADLSHDPQVLQAMVKKLSGCDVVVGSRYIAGGSLDRQWPLWRKFLSGFGNFYARTILGMSLNDMTSGFRMWKREVITAMPLECIRSSGYIFLVEMAYIAHRLGFRFGQVPIYFAERQYGRSKMSFRIQLEAAMRVWQLRGMYADLKHK